MGTERLIADLPGSLLWDFLHFIGVATEGPAPTWTFPKAVVMAGWKHCWDLMLRRGVYELPRFPGFLKGLKAIIKFSREKTDEVAHQLEHAGYKPLARMFKNIRLPTFANWRWTSLHFCCVALSGFLESFVQVFDPAPFRQNSKEIHFNDACAAFGSAQWALQFRFIAWFAKRCHECSVWGGSCNCHRAELLQGKTVSCFQKGRLVRDAHKFGMDNLSDMIDECKAWDVRARGPNFTENA